MKRWHTVLFVTLSCSLLCAGEAVVIDLAECVRLAHAQGRGALQADEELRIAQMALGVVQRDYGPQAQATAGVGRSGSLGAGGSASNDQTVGVSLTQTAPSGASLRGEASVTRSQGGESAGSENVALSVRQPLLRGAGQTVWREPLTAAERALRDAVRRRERDRQQLTLRIARSFWQLQRQQSVVVQAAAAVDRAQFTFDQSRALMDIGKRGADDVFRAETYLISARQQVIDAQALLDDAVSRLRLELAIDPQAVLRFSDAVPALERVQIDLAAAMRVALAQRVDLLSAADQVADSARAVIMARDALWPQLDLSARIGQTTADGEHPQRDWRVALDLNMPLSRHHEEFALEQARIAQRRSQRAYEQLREQVVSEVASSVRDLRQAEESLTLQQRNRTQTQRRAEKALLDFRAGTASNRDLVEAQNEVRAAEDAAFAAVIAYRSAELTVRFDTGTLLLTPTGMWDAALPEYIRRESSATASPSAISGARP